MDDLISRSAAIKAFTGKPPEYYHTSYIVGELNCLPAVNAIPVIRCRDCKYSDVIYDTTSDTMPLKCLNIRYGGVMPDWYCEHGERRDEGETGDD